MNWWVLAFLEGEICINIKFNSSSYWCTRRKKRKTWLEEIFESITVYKNGGSMVCTGPISFILIGKNDRKLFNIGSCRNSMGGLTQWRWWPGWHSNTSIQLMLVWGGNSNMSGILSSASPQALGGGFLSSKGATAKVLARGVTHMPVKQVGIVPPNPTLSA